MTMKSHLVLVFITLQVAMSVAGCGATAARDGDTVKVHYTGRIADGTVFDTSAGSEPLEITLGEGQIILGFEQAVIGMKVAESKTITILADQAYGPHRDNLIYEIDRDELPAEMEA